MANFEYDIVDIGYRNKRSSESVNVRVKRFTLQGERWSRKNLTWNLRLIGKSSSYNRNVENLDEGSVRRVLTHALDMWARRTELTFTELHPDDNTADIQGDISFCPFESTLFNKTIKCAI